MFISFHAGTIKELDVFLFAINVQIGVCFLKILDGYLTGFILTL